MTSLRLTSPAFDDGEAIPEEHGYTAENTNPPLDIANPPAEAETFALIVDDPDAREPAGKIWDHWVIWNIPAARTSIPAGWVAPGAVEGHNDFGDTGWGGPKPPDGEHTYRFLLYALDTELSLQPGVRKDAFYDAAQGHVVGKAELRGTYAP
jgi:Raf kinase inhibitor-like YbhB/YbcL family protein